MNDTTEMNQEALENDYNRESISPDEFITEFSKAKSVKLKKYLLNLCLKSEPQSNIKNLLKKINILSDKIRLLKYYSELNDNSSLIKKFSIFSKQSGLESNIKKEANKIFNKITVNNRKGRKFDGLVTGELSPYLNNNDQYVINELLSKLNNLPGSNSIKKIYTGFISNLVFSFKIIHLIKNKGINIKNIEGTLRDNESKLLKEGMRTVFLNIISLDRSFGNYIEKIKEILSMLKRETGEIGEVNYDLSVFVELDNEKNIENFAVKADELLSGNIDYYDLINKRYENLLNEPLLKIFEILKFPINREYFMEWVKDTPVLYNFSNDFEKKTEIIKERIENNKIEQPGNYEELIRIIYDLDTCFTNKYKIISEISEKYGNPEHLKYCLSDIKNVQFKIENSFINILVSSIKNIFSKQELEQIFEQIQNKIEAHIKDYKESFKKNMGKYFKKDNTKLRKIGRLLKDNFDDEKYIDTETILEFNKLAGTRKKLFKFMKISNFFIAYYLTLNCRLILELLVKYYDSIFKAENVFLKNKLSNSTKEEIYGFCIKYRKEKEFQIEKLNQYINWGANEKKIREKLLEKLNVNIKNDYVLYINKFRIYSFKYLNNYNIDIRDKEGKSRFKRSVKSINSYPDFINSINKVSDLIALNTSQYKILYQYAHLNTVYELIKYIELKIRFLTESVLNTPVYKIKEEYLKLNNNYEYLKETEEKCKEEINLREKYRIKLLSEKSENNNKEIQKRINTEIKGQEECIQRLRKYLQELNRLKEKTKDFKDEPETNNSKIVESINKEDIESDDKEPDEKNLLEMSEKIEKRSDKVQFNAENIFRTLEGKNENEKIKLLSLRLEKIEDEEEKMDTASFMMIKSETKIIIDKTKELLRESKVDKYKMLLALYNVLDSKNDYELKIKILDEFSKHLENKYPKVFLQLKYLLEIQREKILHEKVLYGNKVSEIWESINNMEKTEEKVEYLNELLNNDKWINYHSVIQSIINGFITSDIKTLFEQTEDLPAGEQLDILNKIKEYRNDLTDKETAKKILLKTLELNARRKFITEPGSKVFKSDTLDLLQIADKDADIIKDSINSALLNAEQEAIIEELRKNDVPEEYIEQYKSGIEKRRGLSGSEKKIFKKKPKVIKIPEINRLKDAQKFLGYAESPEEEKLIGELEELLKENKISEAENFIRSKIYWECAKNEDYKKMARLLSTIEKNDIIHHSNELKEEVKNYIQSMESVIMDTAKKDAGDLRKKAEEENIRVESEVYEAEENDENINLDNILNSFENLVYFKSPFKIAEENGMSEDEIKKLPKLIAKYEHEGKFIYLPVHNEVLGTGKLKFIIEKAYLEYTKKLPIDIDISKIKEAWNIVRMQKELIYQLEMLGVSTKEERNDLYQKLLVLIKPEGAKVSSGNASSVKPVMKEEPVALSGRTVKNEKSTAAVKKQFPKKRKEQKKEKPQIKKKQAAAPVKKKEYSVRMKSLVNKSYAPIITDYIKNMFKGKKRKDFVIVANGKRNYYSKESLKGVIEQILIRDFRGKSHNMLLDSIKQDKKLFEYLLKELFLKEKLRNGTEVYFPKCLKK